LVVNADRFQAGRYILAGMPTAGDLETASFARFYKLHRHSKVQVTQLPHVEIDLNSQTEVELYLPWVNHWSGVPVGEIVNGSFFGDPWVYFLYPYYPLITTAGVATASYSIFISYENVKLGYPAVPQMAIDPIAAEQKSAKVGPVSSFLSRVTNSFNIIAEIPLLTTLAAPTAWGADVLRRAANVWGWSSPSNLEPLARVRPEPFSYMASGDAVNNANPMSLFSRNHVKILPGFSSTNADELAIDYIKSIPAWISTFNWTTNDAAGTLLAAVNIDPNYSTTTNDSGGVLYSYPPVCWISNMFRYWRGSLTYKLKFVSTMFHSGRIMIVHHPFYAVGNNHGVVPSLATSAYCYREIVDLRERKEVVFTIPYVNMEPWQAICMGGLGQWHVIVLDPLVAPATVSGTVPIIAEMCGGPDFEVSVPIRITDRKPTLPFTLQMDMPKADNVEIAGTIGGSTVINDKLWNCEACIGEKVSSLRVLLKRWSSLWPGEVEKGKVFIHPYVVDMQSGDGNDLVLAGNHCDNYNFIAPCFLLVRGGMRIKTNNNTVSGSLKGAVYMDNHWNGSAYALSVTTGNSSLVANPAGPYIKFDETLTGTNDFQCPMYHTSYAISLVPNLCNNTQGIQASTANTGAYRPFYTVDYGLDDGAYVGVFRAAADDLNFGYFVSTPTLSANLG
jgi:hypothetical protein